jgi:hypothetical protein
MLLALGCANHERELDESDAELTSQDEAALAPALPTAGGTVTSVHGMCMGLVGVKPSKPRCTLAQLHDFMDFVGASTDPASVEVHQFLIGTLEAHATLQCSSYVDVDGSTNHCIDVVNRDPLGQYVANFFVAYAPDHVTPSPSPEIVYWDEQLGFGAAPPMPDYRAPSPVALDVLGYVSRTAGYSHMPFFGDQRKERVLTFDPRDCAGCGIYSGPSISYVEKGNEAALAGGWWPGFKDSACTFQPSVSAPSSKWVTLTADECKAEALYRTTGR